VAFAAALDAVDAIEMVDPLTVAPGEIAFDSCGPRSRNC
jgi:hypothetical protein